MLPNLVHYPSMHVLPVSPDAPKPGIVFLASCSENELSFHVFLYSFFKNTYVFVDYIFFLLFESSMI